MSDDDRDRWSDPYEPPDLDPQEEQGEKSMSYFAATAWTFLASLAFGLLLTLLASFLGSSSIGLIIGVGVQTIVYLLVLVLILQVYAPQQSVRHFLGLRGTHFAFYPIAGLLGAIAQLPMTALFNFIDKYRPTDTESERYILEQLHSGSGRRIAVCMAIVVIGPFVEEMFFRGAIFRPLRKGAGPWSVVLVTGLLFGVVHNEWQRIIPIAFLGIILGILRSSSGSLVPGFVMHAAFNAITIADMIQSGPELPEHQADLPLSWTLGGTVATFVLVAIVYLLGERTETAMTARQEDLV
ncbi:MAG TPA: CPBP family intramembrane metalloprotease [Polyangium sp.]|nr:CPBP family intramembrane metalloprotease [Polyangium sp.]